MPDVTQHPVWTSLYRFYLDRFCRSHVLSSYGCEGPFGKHLSTTAACRALYWCGSQGAARVDFRSITMHAISNDPEVHAKPCIYCQLDGQEELDVGEDEDLTSNEIMLIPTDTSQGSNTDRFVRVCICYRSVGDECTGDVCAVEPLFQAMCRGAEENPDEVEDDEGAFFFDQSGVSALEAGVQQQLDNMVGRMEIGDVPIPSQQPNGMQTDSNSQDTAEQDSTQDVVE
jgi:hypothetical protein